MTKSNQTNLKIEDVQRREKKSKVMYIRTTEGRSEWMTEHNVSPSKVLNQALDKLMKQKK